MDQSGRSFESESPLRDRRRLVLADPEVELAAGAVVGLEVASAPSSPTEVEPVRSAEPASSHGTRAATAFSTWFDALRVAIPFSSGSKLGMLGVPAVGQLAPLHRVDLARQLGLLLARVLREQLLPLLARARRRACRRPSAKCSGTPSGTRNCASSGQP